MFAHLGSSSKVYRVKLMLKYERFYIYNVPTALFA